MDKANQGALRSVNRRSERKSVSLVAFLMLVIVTITSAFLLFVAGIFFGAPLLQWWREASVRQEQALAAPGSVEEIKLLEEAAIYTLFWERRLSRLQKAAGRFGWDELDLAKAYRLIEAAKSRFQAVEIAYLAWGQPAITYELLKREVDGLYEQLVMTFCEEFELVCERGVPPDLAHFKSGAKPKLIVRPPWEANPGGFYCYPQV